MCTKLRFWNNIPVNSIPIRAGNVVTLSHIQPIKYADITRIVMLRSSPCSPTDSPSSEKNMPQESRTEKGYTGIISIALAISHT